MASQNLYMRTKGIQKNIGNKIISLKRQCIYHYGIVIK